MKKSFKFPDSQAFTLFCTFLMRNDAYSSFMRNLSESSSVSDDRDFGRFNPKDYVNVAFIWSSTPEGSDYWLFLDSKWQFVVKLFKL